MLSFFNVFSSLSFYKRGVKWPQFFSSVNPLICSEMSTTNYPPQSKLYKQNRKVSTSVEFTSRQR